MLAYAHSYKATLEGREYVVTLHVVALGDGKFNETMSVAEALRPLEVCGNMTGKEWGFNELPRKIRELVAVAHIHEHLPCIADRELVERMAGMVEYEEHWSRGTQGTVEE